MISLPPLESVAIGCRFALILFAVMSGLAWLRVRGAVSQVETLRRRGWILLSVAALASSPIRAALLMGYTVDLEVSNALDAVATACACGCFITSLASRGLMRGLSEARVRRGMLVNVAVLAGVVGATCLSR
jgi:hypothetical protein